MQTLKELIDQLPPELQREVRGFAEFLLEKKARTIIPRLSFRRRFWRERSYAAPKRETHI